MKKILMILIVLILKYTSCLYALVPGYIPFNQSTWPAGFTCEENESFVLPVPAADKKILQRQMGVCYAATPLVHIQQFLRDEKIIDEKTYLSLSDSICVGGDKSYHESGDSALFLWRLSQMGKLTRACDEYISHDVISDEQKFIFEKDNFRLSSINTKNLDTKDRDLIESLLQFPKNLPLTPLSPECRLGHVLYEKCLLKRSIPLPPLAIFFEDVVNMTDAAKLNQIKKGLQNKKLLGIHLEIKAAEIDDFHFTNIYGYKSYQCHDPIGNSKTFETLMILDPNGGENVGEFLADKILKHTRLLFWIEKSRSGKTELNIKNPLHFFALNGKSSDLATYIKQLSPVLLTKYLNEKDDVGNTPLHWVIFAEEADSFQKLMVLLQMAPKMINPNLVNHDGQTPLHLAVTLSDLRFLDELLKIPHININQQDPRYKMTPLIVAIQAQNVEAVRHLLREKNLNLNLSDFEGKTALVWARDIGNQEIKKLIQEAVLSPRH